MSLELVWSDFESGKTIKQPNEKKKKKKVERLPAFEPGDFFRTCLFTSSLCSPL